MRECRALDTASVAAVTLRARWMESTSSATCPSRSCRRLVAIAKRRRFGRGEIVFHRGDPADTLHLIASGRFAARVETNVGDTVTVSVFGPGEAFGELALLDSEQRRSTTIAAVEPGETYSVSRDDFTRLRQDYPTVNDVLVRLLAARVQADERPVRRGALRRRGDAGPPPPARAGRPLRRGPRRARSSRSRQNEIAGLAATSRATVNRVLRAEAGRGTVSLQRGQTTIVDPASLARRAGRGDPS